jgi:methyl-accepting chemotaxis protein
VKNIFRFNDWSFGTKIAVALLLVGILPVAITSLILSQNAAEALQQQAFAQLQAASASHQKTLELWLDNRRGDAITIADDLSVRLLVQDMNTGLAELGDGDRSVGSQLVRDLYLARADIDNAGDGSKYSTAHDVYGAELRRIATSYGYADVFVINSDGLIIYTAAKQDDFGTNILDGPYRDSNLSTAFQEVMASSSPEDTAFEDFALYSASNKPAAFFGAPIYDGDRIIGALMLQLSTDVLTDILNDSTGLGETGETYVVGPDKLFRSDSRFISDLGVESTILNPDFLVETEASTGALNGQSGINIIADYRGKRVLSAWSPLIVESPAPGINPEGTTWAFIAEVDEAEVLKPVYTQRVIAGVSALVAALAAAGAAFVLSRLLTRQVNEIDRVFRAVGVGEFDARADVFGRDELGRIADGTNYMLTRFLELLNEAEQERTSLQASVDKLVREVSELASGDLTIHADADEGSATKGIADALNFAISELRSLVSGVEQAAVGVTGASANMTEVVSQMASQASNSAQVAEQAAGSAREGTRVVDATISSMERIRENTQETSTRMKRLGETSQEISEVVRFIEEIADRTTILALNASIQAASAGEAGRGFAVVAEEVQRLAERSTAATRQIENLVKAIQSETNEAVAGIEDATREVVDGSKLAKIAGERMAELNALVSELASLIEHVARNTSQQTEDSVRLLSTLSSNLETSVAAFSSSGSGNGNGRRHQAAQSVVQPV